MLHSRIVSNVIGYTARLHFRNPNLLQQVFSVLFALAWCASAWFVIYGIGLTGIGVVLCFALATIPYLKFGVKALKEVDEYLKSKYPY